MSAKETIKEYTANPKVKAIIVLVVLIIVAYIIFYVVHYLKGKAAEAENAGLQAGTGQNPTLTPAQLTSLADSIDGSFNEFWSNDTDTINSSFSQLNNDADFYGLAKSFGTRSYGVVLKNSYTLSQAIHAFLSPDQITKINSLLATKNIKETI